MLKKDSDERDYFYCETADWNCMVLANDVDEAANSAVMECLETLGEDANVSFAIRIKKIATDVEPSDFLVRIDQIFSDIGMHKEAKALRELMKQ